MGEGAGPRVSLPAHKDPALVLEGSGFHLRPLRVSDATERYAGWLDDPETTRFLETKPGSTTVASLAEYIRGHVERHDSLLLGIFPGPDARHVGNVKLDPIVFVHRWAVLGIMIGEPDRRGQGLGAAVVRRVLDYAFTALALHRVELGVVADNAAAIACYERIGFVLEGVHRERTRRDDCYVDSLHYAILDRDFAARRTVS